MSETLTITDAPQTETAELVSDLTPDEQDSLALGEEIQQQEDQLLAGKYKNAEELEKAYVELQSKLGEKSSEEESNTEAQQEEVLPEESEESPQDSSAATELITSASDEYDKSGSLSAETLDKFNSMSSQELVQAYMEMQAANPTPKDTTNTDTDISDAAVNEVKNYAGGEASYNRIVQWAADNLDSKSIDAFDSIVGTGSVEAIKLAVNGLKTQYENANGYEGNMLQGKAPVQNKDVYRSQAELVAAMSDRRYDNDPAYRQDVIAKLERSDNLTF